MSPEEIIEVVRSKGIQLEVQGENIICDDPQGELTKELIEAVRQNKKRVIHALTNEKRLSGIDQELRAMWMRINTQYEPGDISSMKEAGIYYRLREAEEQLDQNILDGVSYSSSLSNYESLFVELLHKIRSLN